MRSGRPVSVRGKARRAENQHEVGKELERVEAVLLRSRRVDSGWHRPPIDAFVPRAGGARLHHTFNRLGVWRFLRRLPGEREHPMRTIDLVGQRVGKRIRLIKRISGLSGYSS